jgi:small-conductance mechanosensitive channel
MDWMRFRERIAQHTEEQRTVWLHQLRSRYSVWMFIAGVFAVLVTVSAVLAKSVLFGVVAAFLCMFAWNRWTERKRVERWMSRQTPQNQQERIVWARIFYDEMRHPPVWLRITDWISAITAIAFVGTVSVVVVATSGFWMRLLYGLIYFLAVLLVLLWLLAWQRLTRELKAQIALSGQNWSELT